MANKTTNTGKTAPEKTKARLDLAALRRILAAHDAQEFGPQAQNRRAS